MRTTRIRCPATTSHNGLNQGQPTLDRGGSTLGHASEDFKWGASLAATMVGIRIVARDSEQDHMTYQHKPLRLGFVKQHLGYKWVDIEVSDWGEGIQALDIETKTNTQNGGVIGYWVPSKDLVTHSALEAPSFQYEHKGRSGEFFVDQQMWEFGEQPTLRVHRPAVKSPDARFTFSILARPVLSALEPFKLNIRGYANPNNPAKRNKVFEHDYEFTTGDVQQVGEEMTASEQLKIMNQEFTRFKEHDADNLAGTGNIVHPKQFFTIRGLEHVLDNYIDASKKLKLAYIGTDTTENLRSIVRWLNSTGHARRIESLTVFYTTQWDYNFLRRLNLKEQYALQCPELNMNFFELSEETVRLLDENDEKFDAIVATYVAPWAVGPSRASYGKLLNAAMGASSYLVSIDPQNETSSVRSELTNRINSHDLYDDLQMSVAKSPVVDENNSVEWSVWKKNRNSGGGL